MSFREKSAWVMLLAVLVAAVWFFGEVYDPSNARTWLSETTEPLILGVLLALAIVSVIGHSLIAARSPDEAMEPLDERKRGIVAQSQSFGYNTLIVGVLSSFAFLHINGSLHFFAHLVSFSVFASWLVLYGSQIVLFRRGGV